MMIVAIAHTTSRHTTSTTTTGTITTVRSKGLAVMAVVGVALLVMSAVIVECDSAVAVVDGKIGYGQNSGWSNINIVECLISTL